MKDSEIQPKRNGAISDRTNGHLWKKVVLPASLAAGGLGTALVGLAAYTAVRLAKPDRRFGNGEPPDVSYETVSFPSTDGLRLSGWFLPAGEKADGLVLCHGFHTGRRELLPVAMALRALGHNVLIFDFRGHGDSEGRWSSCGQLETRDLEGAVRFICRRPEVYEDRVGVIGYSMGAATAIMTAARVREIRAVVADSPFATLREVLESTFRNHYHVPCFPILSMAVWINGQIVGASMSSTRPLDEVAKISPRPLMLIHGEADRIVPMSESLLLHEAAGEPKELWTVPGVDHVEARLHDLDGYVARVDAFFKKWLAGDQIMASARAQSRR
ncbi:MAG TPA: alpha/beta fold hydrolase [Chloroflexota bacterium]|nr:alpha/beta fold hydrolase [Chloroflexota bacterium]